MDELIKKTDALDIVKRTSGDYAAAWSEIANLESVDATLESTGQWVDIREESPEKPGRYLVALRRKAPESLGGNQCKVTILRFRPDGNFQYPVHFPDWINDEIEETITHWMPLPDLPEKEIQPIWFMENGATFPQTMREEKTGIEWWVRTPHPIFDRVPGLKEVCTLKDICDGFSGGKFYECCHYCKHFSTDGLTSPSGWCNLHPEEGSGFAETYRCPEFERRSDL